MPIVNYVREIERFIEYAADERLTANERCLWYGLMHIFNQRANGNEWPGEFIPITNDRLFTFCPGGFDTLARARNKLKQKKLIDFSPGNRNQSAPRYKMIYFCPEGCPQNTDNIRDNMRDNTGGNIRDNTGGNTGDIYTNINRERYTIPKRFMDDEEEDEENDVNACAWEDDDPVTDRKEREDAIRAAFIRFIGRRPYPAELNKLVWCSHTMQFQPGMVSRAIEIAAGEGAAKPAQYVLSILEDWENNDVLQPHQIEGYRFDEDISRGKAPIFAGTGDTIEDWKISEAHKEERRKENAEAGIGRYCRVAK